MKTVPNFVELNANGAPTSWNYYVTDHLGSTRMIVDSNDSIKEVINYYPFGSEMRMTNPALLTGGTSHPYRFTGKELDKVNNLNMYDFGARWYDVAGVPMWTSVDPLAEKYYNVSPYAYCAGDPVNRFDPDGKDDYYTSNGQFIFRDNKETDNIIIRNQSLYVLKSITGVEWINPDTPIENADLSAEAYSNIFTNVLSQMEGVDVKELHNGKVSVTVWEESNDNLGICTTERYNDSGLDGHTLAETGILNSNGDRLVSLYIYPKGYEEKMILNTVANIQNLLGAHEFLGHYKKGWRTHTKVVPFQRKHSTWNKTTQMFKEYNYKVYGK